jgi:hypothetical protein
MIGVGIHENIILKNVEITEKEGSNPSVDFTITTAGSTATSDDADPFGEAVDENGMLITGKGGGNTTIKVWCLNVPDENDREGKPKSMSQRIQEANDASKEMQNMFTLFAKCYMTSDKIKFERFRGIPITKDNTQLLLTENVLVAITKNLASQFIEMCSEFFGKEEYPLRLLLRRNSTKNHYPKFRDKLLQSYPFVEPAIVPKIASKIAFNKFEVSNKLNDGTPLTETDDIPDSVPATPQSAAALFGGGAPVDLSTSSDLN